jgi:hypothetical protein
MVTGEYRNNKNMYKTSTVWQRGSTVSKIAVLANITDL